MSCLFSYYSYRLYCLYCFNVFFLSHQDSQYTAREVPSTLSQHYTNVSLLSSSLFPLHSVRAFNLNLNCQLLERTSEICPDLLSLNSDPRTLTSIQFWNLRINKIHIYGSPFQLFLPQLCTIKAPVGRASCHHRQCTLCNYKNRRTEIAIKSALRPTDHSNIPFIQTKI